MKTIKINFCNFWDSFNPTDNLIYDILDRNFNVEICDNPDFIICSNRGIDYEYMKYDCPRIMWMGENVSPDFTVIDYCIGFDYLDYGDRFFRLPVGFFNRFDSPFTPKNLSADEVDKIFNQKQYFCNFIYGHQSSHNVRETFLHELGKYKSVISPGRFLNNTGSDGCSWQEKMDFVRKSKFTIACDSISFPGFVTEKIVQAFYGNSVPIYFGDPKVDNYFNPKSFVWCKTVDDIPQTVERVIYLDSNDDEYKKMLAEYPLAEVDLVRKTLDELEKYLVSIFSQEPKNAYRRVRYYAAEKHEKALLSYYNENKKRLIRYGKIKAVKKKIKKML